MYLVTVEGHFDAAHFLREYRGKCENLHGHRFKVVVTVRAATLDKEGMAYDFTELKQRLNKVLDGFDHKCLNEVAPFDVLNPSSENVAETIFKELKPQFRGEISLFKVEVWESPTSCITFIPDDK
jgi:6-pyruvoyltetrahydropterin/6-carboxytetrahydropterin synthase